MTGQTTGNLKSHMQGNTTNTASPPPVETEVLQNQHETAPGLHPGGGATDTRMLAKLPFDDGHHLPPNGATLCGA